MSRILTQPGLSKTHTDHLIRHFTCFEHTGLIIPSSKIKLSRFCAYLTYKELGHEWNQTIEQMNY